jgi:triphosphoribosyl-dephospho-CoA synthase
MLQSRTIAHFANAPLALGQCAELACLLEVSARKPGNVHPQASFEDLEFTDFLLSAQAIAPVIDRALELGVGGTVRECVIRTRALVRTNTNLGIALLLAPLSAVPATQPLELGLVDVLNRLTVEDSRLVFEAIRLAQPGGLGEVSEQDVRSEPSLGLVQRS